MAVLVMLVAPTWQKGALPRSTRSTVAPARTRTPTRPVRATALASDIAPSTPAQAVARPAARGLEGSAARPSSSQSIGSKRTLGAPPVRQMSVAQENELITSAQFFIEQHARRRLLEQLWHRTPTNLEWAAASITFNYVDADNNGRVEASELASIVSRHFDMLCPEVFDAFDDNGEGYLDFAAYAKITASDRGHKHAPKPDAPRSKRAVGKGGTASRDDLSSELCQLSDSLSSECERLADFERQLAHGERALKYLIRANQGMVHQIARQLRPRGATPDLDDMLQDGNMGLMQAVVRFEPSSGCRLSTYSYQWIRGLIMTGLHRRLNKVNLPQVVAHDVHKLRKLLSESARRLVSVEYDELLTFGKQLNWDEGKLQKIVKASAIDTTHCFSLEAGVGNREGSDMTLGDTVTSPTTAATDDFRMTLETALSQRAERNARIIRLRFGLEDGKEHTYTQIAHKIGLSPQRVCNVVNQELRYLKDARSLRAFKDGFDYTNR
ncbi:hypothetical protein KFE25_001859 [Diacronema lutheri]|uniref:RNA polymerase sigma-70 domain-containing protein n=2 Tax=Diacronema lutheri TaxID=2081491 RepID=A0A8J6CFX3_DIALT|nr:hypothetical protein KFE25_001859 [Diacronema lutheri]